MGNKIKHSPRRGLYFYLSLVVVLGLAALIGHFVQSPYGKNCRVYSVSVVLEADQEAALELYYDTGRGFDEKDHQEMLIAPAGEKIKYEFTIPVWREFSKFRIDPVGGGVKMKIHSVEVSSLDGSFTHSVDLEAVSPLQQITNGHWNGSSYSFETAAEAPDPILLVEAISDPHVQREERSWSIYAFWLLGGLLVVMTINWIYRFFILGL
ncbi:MAG: hypothetical protein ABFR63_02575 [Thermodesulfobacteriota bacterium]